MKIRTGIAVTAGCVAVFLGSWSLVHHLWYHANGTGGDTAFYQGYAQQTVMGRMPYRDFSIEYPPGFLIPALAPDATADPYDFYSYTRAFDRWMSGAGVVLILLAAVALARLRATPRQFAGALGFIAVSPLLLGNLVLTRYDMWVAALAIGGLSALLMGRDRTAGAFLGAAIATKIYPLVLVPLGLIWIWRRRGRSAALRWVLFVVAVCAAFFLPFDVLAPSGLGHSFALQIQRPLQVESLGSALLLAAHNLGGLAVSTTTSYGSQNLVAHGAGALASLSTVLQLVGLFAVWAAFARGPARADRLVTAAAASVAVFIAFGKVFSPQYLIWLIPFVPLVRSRLASILLCFSLLGTQFYFPAHYQDLAGLQSWAAWLVLGRDLLVVMLAAELTRALLERECVSVADIAPPRTAPAPEPLAA